MFHTAFRPGVLTVALAASLSFALPGEAGQRSASPSTGRPAPAEQAMGATSAPVEDADADQTRQRLNTLLGRYPPSVGRVLKLDPTLMTNPGYLESYPALAAFLAQHPDVTHNPTFFLQGVPSGDRFDSTDPRLQDRADFHNMLGNFVAFLVFLVVTGVLIWLIRLFVDHRRWNRLSKIQTDVHTKLLDRFSSNEDLLAYIQTTAGRRFLESAPIPIHDESRPLGAPFSRILWSVQAGVVLAVAGVGLLFVSTRFADEGAQFFFVIGAVTLALGGGFILSAVAAYVLSRRLGLVATPSTDHA